MATVSQLTGFEITCSQHTRPADKPYEVHQPLIQNKSNEVMHATDEPELTRALHSNPNISVETLATNPRRTQEFFGLTCKMKGFSLGEAGTRRGPGRYL